MASNLTDISDRLTPTVPIEITFGAQPVAPGTKKTTLFGHRAASGGTGLDYSVHDIVNIGDPNAAKAEVDGFAGSGSQLGKMAYAFVQANAAAGRSNFPAFRIVLIPNAQTGFGPADEAITAVKLLRSDMMVSCYPTSDSAHLTKLINLAELISGPDRDIDGQFGSFVCVASLQSLTNQEAFAINSRKVIAQALPDSNSALVSTTGDTVASSDMLINIASTAGIYPGASVTGTGIPGGTHVLSVFPTSVQISVAATSSNSAEALAFQNQVSQASEIVAAASAGAMMSSAFPYVPLQGVAIGGLIPPQISSDLIEVDPAGSSEAALAAGLSPLRKMPGNLVGFIRTRTTFNLLPDAVTVATAYFDWQDLVVLNDFREVVYQITQNPPFNNNPGGTKASQQIAAKLKDEVLREAQTFEDLGAFQAVKTLAPQFLVQPSTSSRGRFDFKIPVNVLPGLYVIAGNIQAVTDFDFTL